jgi:hypothetical protein
MNVTNKKVNPSMKKAFICMMTLVLAVFTIVPGMSYADESTQTTPTGGATTSVTINVMSGPDRENDIAYSKTITKQDLENAGVLKTTPIACNYSRATTSSSPDWRVLAIKNYASLEDVFKLVTNTSGTGNAWTVFTGGQGGSLQFETTDEQSLYTEWQNFNYSDMKTQTSYYKYLLGNSSFLQSNSTATEIPLAIAFDRVSSAKINESTPADTAFTSIKNGPYTSTVQFFMGLDGSTLNAAAGTGWNMGKRLPRNITTIYVYPAGVTPDYSVDE